MSNPSKLAVIGAGQMGGGVAQVAAQAGFETVVIDASPAAIDACKKLRDKLLARAVEKGKLQQADADATLKRISYAETIDAVSGCDWVIEAVVESFEVKKDIFTKLAQLMPDERSVLSTNTSSISITKIAACIPEHAHRVVGMHFFNPVPVMALVEVIKGLQTSEEVVQRTVKFAEAMGKTPLAANDRPGFVSNRVLMPLINEAFYAWMEGVAEPEAIDGIMKLGCAHPMGPLRLADFIGLDTCVHIMNVLAEGLHSERYRPCPLLEQLVTAGRLGDKTGRGVYDHAR